MGRFYKSVDVERAPEGVSNDLATDCEWVIKLDSRTLRTPLRKIVTLPTESLAWAVAAEWESQGKHISAHNMPMTRLAITAIDQMGEIRERVTDSIMRYLQTDTICFYEDENASSSSAMALADKQAETWDPLHDWVHERFGERMSISRSALATPHSDALKAKVHAYVEEMPLWELSAFDSAVVSLKSFALAAALVHGRLAPQEALDCSRVEENFQIAEWGLVEGAEGHEGDVADLHARVIASSLFVRLLRLQ